MEWGVEWGEGVRRGGTVGTKRREVPGPDSKEGILEGRHLLEFGVTIVWLLDPVFMKK